MASPVDPAASVPSSKDPTTETAGQFGKHSVQTAVGQPVASSVSVQAGSSDGKASPVNTPIGERSAVSRDPANMPAAEMAPPGGAIGLIGSIIGQHSDKVAFAGGMALTSIGACGLPFTVGLFVGGVMMMAWSMTNAEGGGAPPPEQPPSPAKQENKKDEGAKVANGESGNDKPENKPVDLSGDEVRQPTTPSPVPEQLARHLNGMLPMLPPRYQNALTPDALKGMTDTLYQHCQQGGSPLTPLATLMPQFPQLTQTVLQPMANQAVNSLAAHAPITIPDELQKLLSGMPMPTPLLPAATSLGRAATGGMTPVTADVLKQELSTLKTDIVSESKKEFSKLKTDIVGELKNELNALKQSLTTPPTTGGIVINNTNTTTAPESAQTTHQPVEKSEESASALRMKMKIRIDQLPLVSALLQGSDPNTLEKRLEQASKLLKVSTSVTTGKSAASG